MPPAGEAHFDLGAVAIEIFRKKNDLLDQKLSHLGFLNGPTLFAYMTTLSPSS